MEIHERIKYIRKDILKMTQDSFGERLGVSRSVIKNLEYQAVEISDVMIKAICAEFNINEHWFRTGGGTMFKNSDYQAIENLSKTHNLDDLDRKILYEYITLPPGMRAAFKKYLLNLADSVADDDRKVQMVARGKEIAPDEKLSEEQIERIKNAAPDDKIP